MCFSRQKLSISASRLFRDYGIRYQNSRSTHNGRKVSLWKETDEAWCDKQQLSKGVNVLRGGGGISKHCHHRHHIDTNAKFGWAGLQRVSLFKGGSFALGNIKPACRLHFVGVADKDAALLSESNKAYQPKRKDVILYKTDD